MNSLWKILNFENLRLHESMWTGFLTGSVPTVLGREGCIEPVNDYATKQVAITMKTYWENDSLKNNVFTSSEVECTWATLLVLWKVHIITSENETTRETMRKILHIAVEVHVFQHGSPTATGGLFPQIELWSTKHRWSFSQISECQAPLLNFLATALQHGGVL